jgi:hypothetical protein
MKIPEDMYEHVFGLSTDLMNASEAEDMKTYWRLYETLRTYCETESQVGRDHPFLWETLADFTTDDRASVRLYLKAFEQAQRAEAAEYIASIGIALAERYRSIGDAGQAIKYASEANERAKELNDLDLRRQISEFLLNESKNI